MKKHLAQMFRGRGRMIGGYGRTIWPCGRTKRRDGWAARPCARISQPCGCAVWQCSRTTPGRSRVIKPCGRMALICGRTTLPGEKMDRAAGNSKHGCAWGRYSLGELAFTNLIRDFSGEVPEKSSPRYGRALSSRQNTEFSRRCYRQEFLQLLGVVRRLGHRLGR